MKKIGITTGASSGLGAEFAIQSTNNFFLDELWLIARREHKLKDLKEKINIPCKILSFDLTKIENYQKIQNELNKEKIVIKLLVNNAGLGKTGFFKNLDTDHLSQMIMVNSYHPVLLTKMCYQYFTKSSIIINVSSAASFSPLPKFSVYGATKAFVTSFSRAIHEELKREGIHVLAVCPGPVATEFFKADDLKKLNGLKISRADMVVTQAYKDALENKKLSIHKFSMKCIYALSYILPNWVNEKIVYFSKKL